MHPDDQRRFVGREREHALLTDALVAAESGEPRVIVLTGDAGIGKSRLVSEVIRRFGNRWLVACGNCVEAGATGLPYAPLSGVIADIAATPHGARLLAGAADSAPGLLPLVGSNPAADTTTGLAQLRLFDALVRLFGRLSAERPTLVVIEDLHWADQSTRTFLSFLCRNLAPQPLAVLVTVRTDELHRGHPLRSLLAELARLPSVSGIEMGPLDDAELAELLAEHHGAPVPRTVVADIARRSGGNPFFAEQLWAVGLDERDSGLPVELADVLLHRVDQLSTEAQHLLRAASLAGRSVDHDLLLTVADMEVDTVSAVLRECADARLFGPDDSGDTFSFRHALLAEVIAADVVPTQRRALHERYADALAGTAPAAVVARHCDGAADLPGAFAWSVDAAREASAVAAPDDAVAHWERVLELWPHATYGDQVRAGSKSEVARTASAAAAQSGQVHRAAELAKLAVDEAKTQRERALARLALAPLLTPLVTGDPAEEVEMARAAIADAGEDAKLAARGRFILARAHLHAGRFSDAAPLADEVAASGTALGIDDLVLGARATAFLARCQLGTADPHTEQQLAEDALASTDVETALWVLTRLADWWWPTDPVKGQRLAAAAYSYAVEHGVRASIRGVWARETLTLCRWLTGDWDVVEELAAAEPLAAGDATSGTIALECMVDITRGRTERARRRIELATKSTADALSKSFLEVATVDLYLADGEPSAAAALCLESLAGVPPELGFADFEAVIVARGLGAVADAEEAGCRVEYGAALLAAADRVEERAARHPNPRLSDVPLSSLRAHRSRIHDHGDPALWRAAMAVRTDQPYEIAKCRFYLAKALRGRGDAEGAASEIAAAAATCRELGEVVLLRQLEQLAV